MTSNVSSHRMQAYSSVYTVEQELRQELQKQEQAKQQKQDLESRIQDTELRIAKLQQKSQDSREVLCCHSQCDEQLLILFQCLCIRADSCIWRLCASGAFM